MDWQFSIGWFMTGLLIFAAGGAIIFFYKQISDHMLSGVASYDRVKFWGAIIAGVGFIVMTNIHTLLLTLFVNLLTGSS